MIALASPWEWAGAIAAGWFTASILFAIAWNTVGKRIFRKPPQPPIKVDVPRSNADMKRLTDGVVTELKRRNLMDGGA